MADAHKRGISAMQSCGSALWVFGMDFKQNHRPILAHIINSNLLIENYSIIKKKHLG